MRSAVLVALALLIGCSPTPSTPDGGSEPSVPDGTPPPPKREPVLVVPVPAKAGEGSERYEADWSFDLLDAAHVSAHVHVIPPGQMVPLHHHPENWELSWVAGGVAEWWGVAVVDGASSRFGGTLEAGQGFVAQPGAFHAVRNTGEGTLSVVVVHQPRFGQNWYVPEDEVLSNLRATELGDTLEGPDGWRVGWAEGGVHTASGDRLLLVVGEGSLAFEDKQVPLGRGTVASLPPGLEHTLTGRALSIEVPRP